MNSCLKILTIVCLLVFHVLSLKAQSQHTEVIHLMYSTAVRPDNATVEISIHLKTDNTYQVRVETHSLMKIGSSKSIKETILTAEQFSKLVHAVQKIKQVDITSGPHPVILDGEICSISIGGMATFVTYQVNTPTYNTDERKLNDFLEAYKLILQAANLDPNLILG